jgi:hypothetical protein
MQDLLYYHNGNEMNHHDYKLNHLPLTDSLLIVENDHSILPCGRMMKAERVFIDELYVLLILSPGNSLAIFT